MATQVKIIDDEGIVHFIDAFVMYGKNSTGDWVPNGLTTVEIDGENVSLQNTTLMTLLAGEDQDNDVLSVETKFGYEAVDRTTTDVVIGTTGAAGDILQRIIVESVTTTDAEIYDGTSAAGQLIATIPAATAAGTIFEIGCMCTTNWTLALHATDAAALICIGRFS